MLIREKQPDLVFLQEHHHDEKAKDSSIIARMEAMGYHSLWYPRKVSSSPKGSRYQGVVLFSKQPFALEKTQIVQFHGYAINEYLYAQTRINGRKLGLINVHMTSYPPEKALLTPKFWFRHFKRRRREVPALMDFANSAQNKSLPLLVAGDFNANRCEYPLRRLPEAGLQVVSGAAPSGWGGTWVNGFPLFRIDHILASNRLEGQLLPSPGPAGFSDHLPLMARFRWANN